MFDQTKMRRGQQKAFDKIIERIKAREPLTAVILPTRYGKSDLMRLLALHMLLDGIVSGCVVLTPALFLQQQMVDDKKIQSMASRYGIPWEQASNVIAGKPVDYEWFGNGEYLNAMTMQAATSSRDFVAEKCKSMLALTGLPLVFFIDECHQTSEEKVRGTLVRMIVEAGGLVVLMTATAVRADGEIIPAFKATEIQERPAVKVRRYKADDGVTSMVDIYRGVRRLVRLEAHHETTFREAWNELPPVICRLSRETIDTAITFKDGTCSALSDLSEAKCRTYLSEATRHDEIVRMAVRKMLADLQVKRRQHEDIAVIVFTGNDRPGDATDNKEAQHVKRVIHEEQAAYNLSLNVIIATMKSNEEQLAADRVRAFSSDDVGDVLIVKQMGGAGLDAGRVKIVLDLSSVRTVASCVQRYMRAATPYNGIDTATVITLADALSEGIWQKCIVDEGGASDQWTSGEWELVDTKPSEGGEEEVDRGSISDPELGGLDDSDGNEANPASYDVVMRVLQKWPAIGDKLTKAEIARDIAEMGLPVSVDVPTLRHGNSHAIHNARERFNELTKDLASRESGYSDHSTKPWVDARRRWVNRAKSFAGLERMANGHYPKLENITNIETLEGMNEYLLRQRDGIEHSQ